MVKKKKLSTTLVQSVLLMWLVFWGGVTPLIAQGQISSTAGMAKVVYTTDPDAPTTHWYRLVIGRNFLEIDPRSTPKLNRLVAVANKHQNGDNQTWCFVKNGNGFLLYNKGSKKYVNNQGIDKDLFANATKSEATTYYETPANNVNFEFWMVRSDPKTSVPPRAKRDDNGEVRFENGAPNVLGWYPGNAILIQDIELSEQEKLDIIPFLHSENKANGLTTAQVKELKDAYEAYKVYTGKPAAPLVDQRPEGVYDNVRSALNKLKATPVANRSTIAYKNGLYRIQNGHRGFYEKEASVMYLDGNQLKWRKQTTANEEIWKVTQNADGTYSLINSATKQAFPRNNNRGTFTFLNPTLYPGHFVMTYGNETLHAQGHSNGTGSSGSIVNYTAGSTAEVHDFIKEGSSQRYHGASVWLLQPVPAPTVPQEDINNFLNAENVVNGFTSTDLATLKNLNRRKQAGEDVNYEIYEEIERLKDLPDSYRIPYADGLYTIKNGSRGFYEHNKDALMRTNNNGQNTWGTSGNITQPTVNETWYVKRNSDGSYTMTNTATLKTIKTFTVDKYLAGYDGKVTAKEIDHRNYPAQYSLATGSEVAHTKNHQSGRGSEGVIMSYHGEGDNPYVQSSTATNDGSRYSTYSTWMMRPLNAVKTTSPAPTTKPADTMPALTDHHKATRQRFLDSEGKVGGFTATQLQQSGLSSANNLNDFMVALDKLRNIPLNQRVMQSSAKGFVRIHSAAEKFRQASNRKNIFIDYVNNKVKWGKPNATAVAEIWNVQPVSGATAERRTITQPNTSTNITAPAAPLSAGAQCDIIAFDGHDLHPGMVVLKFNGSEYLHGSGHNAGGEGFCSNYKGKPTDVCYYTNTTDAKDLFDQISTWYIEAATTIALQPKTDARYTSFYYPFAIKMEQPLSSGSDKTGVWGCIERNGKASKSNVYVSVKPLSGQYVAKEIPMLLEMEPARNFVFTIVSDEEAARNNAITTRSQIWEGTLAPKAIYTGDLVIRNIAEGRGWFPVTAEPTRLAANKIYIKKQNAPAGLLSFFAIERSSDNVATDIEGIKETEETAPRFYYDLSGRRIEKPTKAGIYITEKGKKVIIK